MLDRRLTRLLRALPLCLSLLFPQAAMAAAYSLPAAIGSGPFSSCSGGGPAYTCSNDVNLGNNDSVTLTANVTLNVNGDFDAGKNVVIDNNGLVFNFNATGDINIDDDSRIDANLDAAGKIDVGKRAVVNGNLTAGIEIILGDDVTVSGNLDSGGKIDAGKRVVLSGDISANDDVKIGDDASLTGNITTSGKIDIGQRSTITGDLDAGDDIKIEKDSVVNGDVITTGNLTIDNNSVVNGTCIPSHPQCTGTPPPVGGSCDTFRDTFLTFGYANQDGTLNWSSDWIETGDDGSHASGSIRLQNNALRLRGGGSAVNVLGGPYVEREADLSAFSSAILSFDYYETGGWEPDDQVDIYVSGDGGANWTLLTSFVDDQGSNLQSFSINITAFISANTRIAFVERADSNGESFFFETVQIEACTEPVDHFNIIPATTSASTCLPNAITIIAADAADNPVTNYSNLVDITVSTNHGNWSVNDADNVTVPSPHTNDDGAVSYTFVLSDMGEIVLDLSNTFAESLTISVTDPVAAVTSVSEVITFADNVFVITEDSVQIAGRPQAMRIEMWFRDTGPSPSCGPDPNYTYSHDLDVSIDRGGVLTGANPPSIGGVPINNGPPAAVPFSFSAGIATFDLDTTDVGQYRLTFTDNNLVHIPTAIGGDSSLLTVRPFGIGVSAIEYPGPPLTPNPGGTAPGDMKFTAAGADFSATVSGVLWDSADDTDNDGDIDAGRSFADNAAAPSYAWDTDLLVSTSGFTPSGGGAMPGVLNNNRAQQGNFMAGTLTLDELQYTEVGSFTLQSLASNYLNVPGLDIGGDDIVVGRFFSAYFDIAITDDGSFAETCGVFTYLGEDFGYDTVPGFTVTAYNDLDDVTRQYRGAFVKLDGSSIVADVSQDSSALDSSGNPMLVSYTAAVMGFTANDDGTVDYSFGADTYRYGPDAPLTGFSKSSGSQVAPFPADIDPEISSVGDGDVTTAFAPATHVFDPVANNQYFGRLRMENVHGSELNPLLMPVVTEYWNGVGFERNTLDTCTTILDADLVTVAEDPPGLSVPTVDEAPAMAGVINYIYPSPGAGSVGFVETRTNLDPAGPVDHLWLRYDWDADGEFDDDPSARATFGIFDGNPVQIYIQQIFQQ